MLFVNTPIRMYCIKKLADCSVLIWKVSIKLDGSCSAYITKQTLIIIVRECMQSDRICISTLAMQKEREK